MQIFKQKNITKSYICLQIPQKSTNFAPKSGNLSKLTSYPGRSQIHISNLLKSTAMATKLPTRRITLMAPFEEVSAKFALQSEKCKNAAATQVRSTPPPTFKYFGGRVINRKTRRAGSYKINTFYFRKNGRSTPPTPNELFQYGNFSICQASALATLQNLSVYDQIQADFRNQSLSDSITPVPIRAGVNSADYATMRGWVFAVRMAQMTQGTTITPTTDTWTFS